MMSANQRNKTHGVGCSNTNLSTTSQPTKQYPTNNNVMDIPNVNCNPKVACCYTHEASAEPENSYATFYNIDDFTGYCETPPVIPVQIVDTSAANPFSSHLTSPIDSFPNVSSQRATYSDAELHNLQQPHQAQPFATLSPFKNDSKPSTCSAPHPQLAQQAFDPQFMESMDYGVPSYDAMDV